MRIVLLAALAVLATAPTWALALTVTGPDRKPHFLAPTRLAALPQVEVKLKAMDGTTHGYAGPTLADVLKAAEVTSGGAVRGPDMATIVLVTAADGYQVALGLADSDASIRSEPIIIAITEDGHPLDAKEGPVRLVVGGDSRPARSARMVTDLDLVRSDISHLTVK